MYLANEKRYHGMRYNRIGDSGLKLPAISLGLWNNFGGFESFENSRLLVRKAFDLGITHFDLANNYGPPPGSAEETFGRILEWDLKAYRDEIIVSTKAGYAMFPGPYGDGGSKKYLISSLDASLKRLKLNYVDIYYHHRPDPKTHIEETALALDLLVRQGKALYIGISNYYEKEARAITEIFAELKTPFVINQLKYSIMDRRPEKGVFDFLKEHKKGAIVFSPLEQGILTNRYLSEIPRDSRAAKKSISFLNESDINKKQLNKIKTLNNIAKERNQTLAQMALSWVLKDDRVSSAIIGASKVSQIEDNVLAVKNLMFTKEELDSIDRA